jgi:hypothetical protein
MHVCLAVPLAPEACHFKAAREDTNPNFEVARAPLRRERRAWTKMGSFVRMNARTFGGTTVVVEGGCSGSAPGDASYYW